MRDLQKALEAPEEAHVCEERDRHRGLAVRISDTDPPEELYGAAITRIEQLRGRWWAHNGEYATEITFCPFCGAQLRE
jgi:hypothetical protein